jgi:hypothetical protein
MVAKVHNLDIVLHLEVGALFHIPIFFAQVGHRLSNDF